MGREHRVAMVAAVVAAAALIAYLAVPASGTARASDQVRPSIVTSLTVPGQLDAVAALSPADAWAVGYVGSSNPAKPVLLIEHWNGVSWKRMKVPHFPYGRPYAVAAVSKNDVWVVGLNESPVPGYLEPPTALVLHWNGRSWSVASSLFNNGYIPDAISATAKQVWVAERANGFQFLHYLNGHWFFVPAGGQPADPEGSESLVMTGPKDGWLGTNQLPGGNGYPVAYMMRWNGVMWRSAPVKVRAATSEIDAMAGLPGGVVLAVGSKASDPVNNNTYQAMSLRWDGKAWHEVPVGIQGAAGFQGVGKIPGGGGTAWAVGFGAVNGALIARWTGSAWKLAPSPPADSADILQGVAASSASDAWAVGETFTPPPSNTEVTVILHWNGKTWS